MVRLSKYASPCETNALLCSLLSTFPEEESLVTLTSISFPCWLNAFWWANYKMAVYILSLAWNFCLPQSVLFCLREWVSCQCSENTNILHKSRGQHLSWNTRSSCNIRNHADFPLTTQTWNWRCLASADGVCPLWEIHHCPSSVASLIYVSCLPLWTFYFYVFVVEYLFIYLTVSGLNCGPWELRCKCRIFL